MMGRGGGRTHPGAFFLVAVLILWIGDGTLGQEPERTQDLLLDARLDVRDGLRFTDGSAAAGPEAGCDAGSFTTIVANRATFSEDTGENGCGRLHVPVTLPTDLDAAVTFEAYLDRSVAPRDPNLQDLPVAFDQIFRVMDGEGRVLMESPLVAPQDRARHNLRIEQKIEADPASVAAIGVWFEDRSNPGLDPAASGSIKDPVILQAPRALAFGPPGALEPGRTGPPEAMEALAGFALPAIDIPRYGPGSRAVLRLADIPQDFSILTPQGQVIDEEAIAMEERHNGTFVAYLDHTILNDHGAGTYLLLGARPSPPAPALGGWSLFGMLLVPLSAAVLAIRGWARLRPAEVHAEPASRRRGHLIGGLAVGGFASFAGVAVYTGDTDHFDLLAGAWTAYTALVASALVTSLFLVAWYLYDKSATLGYETAIADSDAGAQALATKAEELEGLVYSVSHDLKTPLIAMQWLAKDLESSYGSGDPEELRDTIGRISRNANQMQDFVHDILELMRLDQADAPTEPVDVRAVVDDAVASARDLAERRGCTIEVKEREVPTVRHSGSGLRTVFTNLIGNAVKYGKDEGRVAISFQEREGDLIVTVDDDGPGIPAEERETLFELFRRGEDAIDRGIEGTGVGLALVRKTIRAHGGEVTAGRSDLGGARFVVRIPTGT